MLAAEYNSVECHTVVRSIGGCWGASVRQSCTINRLAVSGPQPSGLGHCQSTSHSCQVGTEHTALIAQMATTTKDPPLSLAFPHSTFLCLQKRGMDVWTWPSSSLSCWSLNYLSSGWGGVGPWPRFTLFGAVLRQEEALAGLAELKHCDPAPCVA